MGLMKCLFAVCLAALCSGTSLADVLSLKDGRMFDQVRLSQEEDGVIIHFENGDVRVPNDRIHEAVIPEAIYVPQNEEERKKIEQGFVRYEGEWMDPGRRDRQLKKKLEEQRETLEAMKRVREWRNRHMEETKNFAFESTVPIHVFESYRDLCETYFTEFCKMWKIKKPRGLEALPLRFYIDREKFMQITGMPRGVGGFFQFIPTALELHIFYDRLDARFTEEVMYHEVGHYLMKLIDVEFKYPHWPGEALSEYYGASTWDPVNKKLTWGLMNESRLAQIRNDISHDQRVSLKGMILGCQDRNFTDYSWGWSFVHMLLESSKYKKNFQKFFLALARGRDIDRVRQQYPNFQLKTVEGGEMLAAFMKYMKLKNDDDLAELEKEWYDYIDNELTISTSRGLESAAHRAYEQGREKKARRMWEEAIEGGTETALTFFRYANLLEEEDEHEKARENWRKAIEIDSVTPEFYIALGESLLFRSKKEEDKKEGRRLVGLALELEPDNYYLKKNAKRLLED